MGYFTLKSILNDSLEYSKGSWFWWPAAYDLKEREKQRKHLKKKREKEEKRGERGELISQAWFEHIKYFTGCNFHPRSL